MRLGELIKQLRIKAKLSQTELGKKCGLSQTTISDLERGRNDGSTELPSIAKALGMTTEELLSHQTNDRPIAAPTNVVVIPRPRQAKINQLMKLVEGISEPGISELIGAAKQLAKTSPYTVKSKHSK
jgi:transcriptional regulator with XRE-family HTH domain